jgi:hypothetical protein
MRFSLSAALPDRVPLLRLDTGEFKLPEPEPFDMSRCLAAWRAIGLINNPEHIQAHMERLKRWQQRK